MSSQIATSNTKDKKAGHAELARKLDTNDRAMNFCVLFAAYRACVQGPLPSCLVEMLILTDLELSTYVALVTTDFNKLTCVNLYPVSNMTSDPSVLFDSFTSNDYHILIYHY